MNDKLAGLLSGGIAPQVYHYKPRTSPTAIAAIADRFGWRFFHLDGRYIHSKTDFLAACGQSLDFPDYYGRNWDALEECLRDMEWAPTQHGYLLLYDHVHFFAAAQPDEFQVALDILQNAVRSWQDSATPLVVLLRSTGRLTHVISTL